MGLKLIICLLKIIYIFTIIKNLQSFKNVRGVLNQKLHELIEAVQNSDVILERLIAEHIRIIKKNQLFGKSSLKYC